MINLLPWREHEKQRSQLRFVSLHCIAAILIFCTFYTLRWHFTREGVRAYQNTVALRAHIQKTPEDHLKQNSLLLSSLKNSSAEKLTANKINENAAQLLSVLANNLPNSMIFSDFTLHNDKLVLSGIGNSLSEIHDYTEMIQKQLGSRKITLSEVQNDPKDPSQLHFTIRENT